MSFIKIRKSIYFITIFCCSIFLLQTIVKAQTSGTIQWQRISLAAASTHPNQTAALVFDIDRDGTKDIVVASRHNNNSVVWYKKSGNSYTKYVIEPGQFNIEAGGAYFDIDGDGDTDVVFGNDNSGNGIWWWENPTNPTQTWPRHIIKNSGGNKHHDSIFADVDGDGRVEFITWNQGGGGLIMAEIPSNPQNGPWTFTTIATLPSNAEGIDAADIDLDGKIDIIGAGRWFKHTQGTQFQTNVIDSSMTFTRTAVGQLIPGGRPEVVFVCGDCDGPLKMYSWNGSNWTSNTLIATSKHGHSLSIGDINGDSKLDIFNGEMGLTDANPQTYILFGDGAGTFQKTQFAGQLHHESRIADMDLDGDLDIVAKPYKNTGSPEGPSVYLNQNSTTPPSPTPTGPTSCNISTNNWRTTIVGTRNHRNVFIYAEDLNADNRKDIITGDTWFKNPGTANGNWQKSTLGTNLNNVAAVYDFDGDGDKDVLATDGGPGGGNPTGRTLTIGRNNGAGTFTNYTTIQQQTQGDFLQGVAVGMFTATTPQVALSWHRDNNNVQLYTFPAGLTGQGTFQNISTTQGEALSSGDIDRDGKIDLLQGTKWLKNNNGSWQQNTLSNVTGAPDRNKLVDINNDNKLDAVIGFEAINIAGKLAWYEQTTATGTWTEHIISNQVIGPMSLDTADMDRDGDIDVIVGEHNYNSPQNARLFIFENRNNGANWTQHQIAQGHEHHDGAQTVDIDNDGDLDVMSIGWNTQQILLYENTANCSSVTPITTLTPSPTNTQIDTTCTNKFKGDANCTSNPAGKAIDLLDYAIWYSEFIGNCSNTNAGGCGSNNDNIGTAMDANFNYPGTQFISTDMKVDIFDYAVWIQGFISTN